MADARYAGFLPGKHAIEGYGAGGFHFGGMSHRGSILALPSGIHAWGAVGADDISIESLAPLFAEVQGAIEFLLVGTGIRAEPMPTAAAARTYSVLLAEDRRVAAALIAVP